jgi:mono/diheme cytochrome c family protein
MLRFLIAGALLACTAAAADVADGRVTYNRDVLPIFEKNCLGCHRPGQIAPMSFLTYETTRPWAPQIKAVVAAKKMPPAVTSPHYIMLTKDDGLTQAEVDTIVKWVDGGAAEGTAQPARKKPAR